MGVPECVQQCGAGGEAPPQVHPRPQAGQQAPPPLTAPQILLTQLKGLGLGGKLALADSSRL